MDIRDYGTLEDDLIFFTRIRNHSQSPSPNQIFRFQAPGDQGQLHAHAFSHRTPPPRRFSNQHLSAAVQDFRFSHLPSSFFIQRVPLPQLLPSADECRCRPDSRSRSSDYTNTLINHPYFNKKSYVALMFR
ncbi:Uncharacterized protein Fot_25831 [Forsythia ovata]|uniref:Uncharacterized protein n=1 Tax=Forsythia ovata TaxID=205694 RepID=A0ABD1UA63_9LAMI